MDTRRVMAGMSLWPTFGEIEEGKPAAASKMPRFDSMLTYD